MLRNRIDVHAHYVGGSVAQALDGRRLRGGDPVPRWSAEQAIAFMDELDIATQILSVPAELLGTSRDQSDAARHARLVRAVNEEYAELILAHPGRFGAFASLPLATANHAVTEIAYALDVLGLDGVTLASNHNGMHLGNPLYEPVFAELERRRAPIFLRPGEPPHVADVALGRPAWILELPFETARTVADALFRGVFRRHPRLTMILAHCGGALPSLAWRLGEHAELAGAREYDAIGEHDDPLITREHVATTLRGLYYDTAIAAAVTSILPALQVTDPDHIVFGTDWPAVPPRTVQDGDAQITELAATTELDSAGVDRRNALPLFPRLMPHSPTPP